MSNPSATPRPRSARSPSPRSHPDESLPHASQPGVRPSSSLRFNPPILHKQPATDDANERTAFASREIAATGSARGYSTTGTNTRTRNSSGSHSTEGARGSSRSDTGEESRTSASEGVQRKPRGGVAEWWREVVEKYGSVELDNKGSVARDHLALERTFLAWLRTSLAFASIGIAVTQLFRLNTSIATNDAASPSLFDAASPTWLAQQSPSGIETRLRHVGKPLGATFIAVAMVVLFTGYHRYFEGQHYILRGRFPASRGSVVLVAGCAGALIVTSLVVVLAIGRTGFDEK